MQTFRVFAFDKNCQSVLISRSFASVFRMQLLAWAAVQTMTVFVFADDNNGRLGNFASVFRMPLLTWATVQTVTVFLNPDFADDNGGTSWEFCKCIGNATACLGSCCHLLSPMACTGAVNRLDSCSCLDWLEFLLVPTFDKAFLQLLSFLKFWNTFACYILPSSHTIITAYYILESLHR